MANLAPGVSVNVSAASPNTLPNNPTGTWFVVGNAAGPAGMVVPIQSINDFTAVFGKIINGSLTGRYSYTNVDSTLLYDALDVYFKEGGIQAFVSRVEPTSTGVTATSTTTGGKFLLTANGKGTWANSSDSAADGVILNITGALVNGSTLYSVSIVYNGQLLASVGGLSTDTDVINWVNSLPAYQSMVTASAISGSSVLPVAGSSVSVYMSGGTDTATADADVAPAIALFNANYGVGQISFPGSTSATVQQALANHAAQNNRVALVDAPNTAVAADIIDAANTLKYAVTDASYVAMFAPWVKVPGVVNTNPTANSGIVFNRTVAPTALAAAKMARNDVGNDANVPAAGSTHGASTYVSNVTATYNASDLGNLNAAGVNAIRLIPTTGVIAVYGFRTLAVDPRWAFLNNARFRMQITRDLDSIAEGYVFQEIDGKGHIFSQLAGAIGGTLQQYWIRGSLYGLTANEAFSVNTGPQVNTPVTIAAGQINAQVALKMSPFGEFVTINVVKYAVNASLPQ